MHFVVIYGFNHYLFILVGPSPILIGDYGNIWFENASILGTFEDGVKPSSLCSPSL